ncbi:MAG TPA: ABC transporter ATP-binding protein [Polyangiaceae bacterium]
MAHPLTRLFAHARKYRKDVLLASLFSVLNKLFDVLPEVLIGVAVDVVVSRKDSFLAQRGVVEPRDQLWFLALLTVLVWVFESLFEYLYALRWRNLAQDVQHDLRMDAYRHVQRLELGWFERRRTGNLMSVLSEDINQLERFLNGGANDLIQVLTSTVLVSGVFFVLAPEVAGLALIPVPFIIYGAFWFQRRLAAQYAGVREAAGTLNARLNNNLLGIATIKAYAAEDYEATRIEEASVAYRTANAAAIRWSSAITPVIRLAILAGFAVTLIYGGLMALDGEIGVGSYSVLVYLTQRLLWPMTRLADMSDLYQRAMASVDRVMTLLETPLGIGYRGQPLPAAGIEGSVTFQDVNFDYGDGPTLEHVSLLLPAGKTTAFVGGTGGGKSTLVKLLLRFYEPRSGQIELDGQALDAIDLADLRRAMGYVAQDSFLTDASVAENIAYGLRDVPHERIVQAAEAAEAHEFIQRLPQGYDTPVGERGQRLSGGQRQRIALARAIVRDPRILLLDEATSAVDNETEAAIQRSLKRLAVGRTSVIIAHRLSTVRHADVIHVVSGGRIVESGTHAELLARNGQYAALFRLQTGESVPAP